MFTMLFRKRLARCLSPSRPISLLKSLSVVSVWVKREYRNQRNQEKKKFTVLLLKVSVRYWAASSPIPGLPISVLLMSSVVSVCAET